VSFVADSSQQAASYWIFNYSKYLRKFIPPLGWNAYGNIQLQGCALSAAAINELFAAVGTNPYAKNYIDVQQNPGSSTCDPSIATAKGWLVYT
jgi:hypothetical protein